MCIYNMYIYIHKHKSTQTYGNVCRKIFMWKYKEYEKYIKKYIKDRKYKNLYNKWRMYIENVRFLMF